jgi:hypothetical protein
LRVSITNGNTTVILETMTENSPDMGQWNFRNFELSQHITLTSNMQLVVETADWDALGGHLVEGGFDMFQITSSLATEITNISIDRNRKLIKVIDILGREVNPTKHTQLFYIYDDGTVEKRFIIK